MANRKNPGGPTPRRPAKYNDPHGQVVFKGSGSTRISLDRYYIYDGREHDARRLFCDEEGKPIHIANHPGSIHRVIELMKGMVFKTPGILNTYSREQFLFEMAAQSWDEKKIRAIMNRGWRNGRGLKDLLAYFINFMAANKTFTAVTVVGRHDEDLRKHSRTQQAISDYSARRPSLQGITGNVMTANRTAAQQRRVCTLHCAKLRMMQRLEDESNQLLARNPIIAQKGGEDVVVARKGKKHSRYTEAMIDKVDQ